MPVISIEAASRALNYKFISAAKQTQILDTLQNYWPLAEERTLDDQIKIVAAMRTGDCSNLGDDLIEAEQTVRNYRNLRLCNRDTESLFDENLTAEHYTSYVDGIAKHANFILTAMKRIEDLGTEKQELEAEKQELEGQKHALEEEERDDPSSDLEEFAQNEGIIEINKRLAEIELAIGQIDQNIELVKQNFQLAPPPSASALAPAESTPLVVAALPTRITTTREERAARADAILAAARQAAARQAAATTPAATTPAATTPEAITPEAITPEAITPEAITPAPATTEQAYENAKNNLEKHNAYPHVSKFITDVNNLKSDTNTTQLTAALIAAHELFNNTNGMNHDKFINLAQNYRTSKNLQLLGSAMLILSLTILVLGIVFFSALTAGAFTPIIAGIMLASLSVASGGVSAYTFFKDHQQRKNSLAGAMDTFDRAQTIFEDTEHPTTQASH